MTEETNIFSIKAQKTKYSRYGNSLERLFKNNSLDFLQNKLKFPRFFKPKDENVDDFNSKNKLNLDRLAMDLVSNTVGSNRSPILKTENYLSSNSKFKNFSMESRIALNQISDGNASYKKTKYGKKESLQMKRKSKSKIDEDNEYEKEPTIKELLKQNREIRYELFYFIIFYFYQKRIKREKELRNEAPDMWKYNPNYNIRFKNCPRIVLPPITCKNKHKDDSNIHDSHLKTLNTRENESLDEFTIHKFSNTNVIKKAEDEVSNHSNSPGKSPNSDRKNTVAPHHIVSDNNLVKHSSKHKGVKTPFSKKNRVIKFDKYTGREKLKVPITNDINYVLTEPKK